MRQLAARFPWPAGGLAALVALCGAGCGAQEDDEIPPALLDAIAQGQQSAKEYPEGPYGGAVGEVASNVCIQAWEDPKAESYDPEALEERCLADYWDPDGKSHRLLLINTAAIWCGACQTEYKGSASRLPLREELADRYPLGLRALGALFQKADTSPADPGDAELWAENFEVDFPFGVDETFQMGAFADPTAQPLNLLIDTTTMEVLYRLQGDLPGQLWPAVDDFLRP